MYTILHATNGSSVFDVIAEIILDLEGTLAYEH